MPRGRSSTPERPRGPHGDRHTSPNSRQATKRAHSRSSRRYGSRSKSPRRYISRSRSPDRRHYSRSPARRRHRSRSLSPKRRRSRSPKRSGSHSRREKSRRKRSRSRSLSSFSSSSTSRRERKRAKKKKKEKKEKKRKDKYGATTSHAQWGKYGVISEGDIYTKGQEFHTWLVEERKINPETISKDLNRKEFARFVEDFNTATLPHEKYYDITAYEARMSALRSGTYLPPPSDSYDANADLMAHASKHKKASKEHESYLSKEQLMELRKVQHERIEVSKMKLLGMDVKQNMGVRMDGSMFDD